MESQKLLRLLLFVSIFISVAFCSDSLTPLIPEYSNTITEYPFASVVPNVLYYTGYPGRALVEVSAVSSIIVCISPYTAVTANLDVQCPNPIYFFYDNPSPVNEFLLFLDDFSMNFLDVDGKLRDTKNKMKKNVESSFAPYSPQNASVPLLQNVPYFVSVGLYENATTPNATLREVTLNIETQYSQCPPNTVPNFNYGGSHTSGESPCQDLDSQLDPTNSTSTVMKVTQGHSTMFSFDITTLSIAAQLDFHILSEKFNLTIYFGFNYEPTIQNHDFSVSNSSSGFLLLEEFLIPLHSFSYQVPSPKTGTYYALVVSSLDLETRFYVEFNTTSCDIGGSCGSLTFSPYLSTEMNATNITLTETIQYLTIAGDSAILGVDTGNSGVAYVQMDVNSIPSGTPGTSLYQYNVTSNVFEYNTTGSSDQYIFGLLNSAAVFSASQDAVVALVWTGSLCPLDCSNQGTCNIDSTCSCNNGWQGRYCQVQSPPSPPSSPSSPPSTHKKLSTLYIILIIIGGAIVLAILIGVPLAYFLHNRKKARYERV